MTSGVYPRTKETKEKLRQINLGSKHPQWKGGRHIHSDGYVYIYKSDHPYPADKHYVLEHRLVMEKHLGRYLRSDEEVHHINGIRHDNRLENLQLVSHREHMIRLVIYSYG